VILEKLGATGNFPKLMLDEHDEGGLKMAIGRTKGCVKIVFGTPVAWLALYPQEAKDLAVAIIEHANKIERGH
jgi:hypothetical protein